MKLREFTRLLSPTYWLIVLAVAALAIFGIWWMITEPGRAHQRTAEAKTASAMSDARAGSAKDAVAIVVEQGDREDTIDSNVMEAERELRQAPEGDRNRIALRRLCLSDAARNDPACRSMQQPRP